MARVCNPHPVCGADPQSSLSGRCSQSVSSRLREDHLHRSCHSHLKTKRQRGEQERKILDARFSTCTWMYTYSYVPAYMCTHTGHTHATPHRQKQQHRQIKRGRGDERKRGEYLVSLSHPVLDPCLLAACLPV